MCVIFLFFSPARNGASYVGFNIFSCLQWQQTVKSQHRIWLKKNSVRSIIQQVPGSTHIHMAYL